MKRAAVIVFPGSNCDHDLFHVLEGMPGATVRFVWHKDTALDDVDAVFLPGGFSYGDYLRAGAIARFSPVMREVVRFARAGGTVVGICNGFQLLCEAGLLPGALLRNKELEFVCRQVYIRTETTNSPFTNACTRHQVLKMPVAHGEGNYFAEPQVLDELRDNDQILFRYCRADGSADAAANPNGSLDEIAGITNRTRNVLGMMPHPERAADSVLGSSDGLAIFHSVFAASMHAG